MFRTWILSAALALLVSAGAWAGEKPAPAPVAGTTPATTAGTPVVEIAGNASCASACQAAHDRCRVQRKGSPSCDAERQACLMQCLKQKRR